MSLLYSVLDNFGYSDQIIYKRISSCQRLHIILPGTYDDHSEEGKDNEEGKQNEEGEQNDGGEESKLVLQPERAELYLV